MSRTENEGVKTKRKTLFWICLLTTLLVGGYFAWQFFQRKAVGIVRVSDVGLDMSLDEKNKKRLYKGKFVEFFHEAPYVERSHSVPESGPIKETVFLSTLDVEGRKIAVTVARRDTADLISEPAFQLRQSMPEEYRPKNFQKGAYEGVLFEKTKVPFEITAFFVAEGYIVSFSVTSPFKIDGLEEELLVLIEGFVLSSE